MNDHCQVGKPSWYVTSHPGPLSLISSVKQEAGTGQSRVMLVWLGKKAQSIVDECGGDRYQRISDESESL